MCESAASFQGLMKSVVVPVLLNKWAPLSFFTSPPFFLPLSTPPYPLLSLTLLITKHRASDEQVALRAAVYKTRCASMSVCVNTCTSACVSQRLHVCVCVCVSVCLCVCASATPCSDDISDYNRACLTHQYLQTGVSVLFTARSVWLRV